MKQQSKLILSAQFRVDGALVTMPVKGRDAWALRELVRAGKAGCSSVDNPAPRWSSYIHNLRKEGVPIKTLTEAHQGPFPGTHGRYILETEVALSEPKNSPSYTRLMQDNE